MKFYLLALFVAVSICSGLSVGAAIRDEPTSTGNCGENIAWSFYENSGLFKVSGTGNMTELCDILMIDKRGVLAVEIGNGITSINAFMFDWYTVKSVTIPSSVLYIEDGAFQNCKGLKSITIPDSVISIGASAFLDCYSLSSVKLPSGLTSIPYSLFYECRGLTSITIPESVKTIGSYAFANTNITSIQIPSGVESIGDYAFYQCACLESVTIPQGIETLPMFLFYGCSSLTTVTLPQSITSIGVRVFQGTNIDFISIPGKVKEIGEYAFYECDNLATVFYLGAHSISTPGVFDDCEKLSAVCVPPGYDSDKFCNVRTTPDAEPCVQHSSLFDLLSYAHSSVQLSGLVVMLMSFVALAIL